MSLTSPIHVGALIYISGPDGLHPATIARVMPTQILTDCGRRYRQHHTPHLPTRWLGREVGNPNSMARLPTPGVLARYKRECEQRAAERAKRMGFTQEVES